MSDPKTIKEKHDGSEDDDDGAPLRFPLSNTSQVNRDLSIKKSTKSKSKVEHKPSNKNGEVRKPTIKTNSVVEHCLKSTISSHCQIGLFISPGSDWPRLDLPGPKTEMRPNRGPRTE